MLGTRTTRGVEHRDGRARHDGGGGYAPPRALTRCWGLALSQTAGRGRGAPATPSPKVVTGRIGTNAVIKYSLYKKCLPNLAGTITQKWAQASRHLRTRRCTGVADQIP